MILEKTTGKYILYKMAWKGKIPKTLSGRKRNPQVPQELLGHKSSKAIEIYMQIHWIIWRN